jgi:hypothetical protein
MKINFLMVFSSGLINKMVFVKMSRNCYFGLILEFYSKLQTFKGDFFD